jgi:hypothetical protein
VNASKPPILVVVATGILSSAHDADDLIEDKIMDKIRGHRGYLKNDIKLVLDLRGVQDLHFYPFECVAYRWARYANVRCERIVVVIPEKLDNLLKVFADEIKLKDIVKDTVFKIVSRSRDVHQALNS